MTCKSTYIGWLIIWLILTGCQPTTMTPTPLLCNGYPMQTSALPTCIAVEAGTLVQTALNQQTQITLNNIELTIKGTTLIHPVDNTFTIIVLESSTVVGVKGSLLTVNSKQQVTIDESLTVGEVVPYDLEIVTTLPLEQLRRTINIVLPTPTIELTATPLPDCPRPDNWTEQYQIQPGDNLTSVAQKAKVTIADLQTANCLQNPNNLKVGELLYVPQNALPTIQPDVTFTPSAVFFRVDKESISKGDCTTLRWDVQNIRDIMLDETRVTNQISQEVCPAITTTYTLTVLYFDDTQTQHLLTITVTEP